MIYDWYVDVNEKYKHRFLEITVLDKNIKEARDKNIKKSLEIKREKLWVDTWKTVCETIPFYSSQTKIISSVSFEQESLQDILRERYIEIIYTEKNQISNYLDQLTSLYEIFKTPKINNINEFPLFSFFLQFTFTLAKPYLSKDEDTFYICENPVKKDKVFKVPMVSGSTWKGNMRWTAGRLLETDTNVNERLKKRIQISNLFGNENEAEERYFDSLMPEKRDDFKMKMRNSSNKEGLRRGQLNFYPTFFDKISLDVINPHDRKTKAGTVPIYIESVPEEATGTFSLLYVPFDLMGKPAEEIKQEVTDNINMVYDSLKEMMLTYGFSAKKSSGFGVTEKEIKGIFEMSGNKDSNKQTKPEPVKQEITKKKTYSTFNELLRDSAINKYSKQPTNLANSATFSSFLEMRNYIEKVKKEVMESAK